MKIFEQHPHWSCVKKVCKKLNDHGYTAFLAGGCVRDALLGKIASDFDVATDAQPNEVEKLFSHSVPIGKQFGIILLPFKQIKIEVATFRKDGTYLDGRHPSSISFAAPREDALRRDFTINALFYDFNKGKIIDYVEGEKDLKQKIICCVGDPFTRFEEDKLRILRAIRFSSQLGFKIDPATMKALIENRYKIFLVAHERIRQELCKLLNGASNVLGLYYLEESHLLDQLFPELIPQIEEGLGWTQIKSYLKNIADKNNESLIWSLFFCKTHFPSYKNELLKKLKRFTFPTKLISNILNVLEGLSQWDTIRTSRWGEQVIFFSKPFGPTLLEAKKIIHNFELGRIDEILDLELQLKKIVGKQWVLPKPFLNGEDLIKLGIRPGPKLGEYLNELFLLQLENKISNSKEAHEWITRWVE